MILRVLLTLFFSISLYGSSNSWSSKIDSTLEVGIFLPTVSGTLSNHTSVSDFKSTLGYSKTEATYLSADIKLDYTYAPNISLGYFNMQDNATASLYKKIQIADNDFNTSISSQIDYQVFNVLLYKDLKIKGKMTTLFGKSIYSGDIEFDIGLNTKLFQWKYQVQDLSDLSRASSWIKVNEFIPLPYLGIKYHWYNLKLYADMSTLAFSSAKSTSYQFGLDYRVVAGLYLSASYLSEEFKVLEDQDTIDFQTNGYKFSFKYAF